MATYQNVNEYELAQALKAEKVVGEKAARLLQASLRRFIGFETVKNTGKLLNTYSFAQISKKSQELDALVIRSPKYGFMLNYGFEGVKSNGISMKLKATNHLANAIDKSNILEILATELTSIKGDQVMAYLNFNPRG